MSLLNCATLSLVHIYSRHSSSFRYTTQLKDRGKILTRPCEGVANDRHDNANGDYIFRVGDTICASEHVGVVKSKHYIVESLLGAGSFGQVFRCVCAENHQTFAVKVIKNLHAYNKQALVEKSILENLIIADPDDHHHMLRLTEYFVFRNHYCFVTEMLGIDLYSVLKQNRFRGFSLNLLSRILYQILECLALINEIGLIHSDLKPENILLDHCLPHIKVIDFGSAAFEGKTQFTYIQSRYYRSPEVLLGRHYDCRIDMWSLGCIAAELFIGHPLFPGCSEHDQIYRITRMLGPFPRELINDGNNSHKFYTRDSRSPEGFTFVSFEEYVKRTGINKPPKQYGYIFPTLEETISRHQMKNSKDGISRIDEPEFQSYLHFIRSCLEYFPERRLTPLQALQHPFILGQPFDPHWTPPVLPPRKVITPRAAGIRSRQRLIVPPPPSSSSHPPRPPPSSSSLPFDRANFGPFDSSSSSRTFDGVFGFAGTPNQQQQQQQQKPAPIPSSSSSSSSSSSTSSSQPSLLPNASAVSLPSDSSALPNQTQIGMKARLPDEGNTLSANTAATVSAFPSTSSSSSSSQAAPTLPFQTS